MPVAKDFAGVNMRLEPGAYRELHWHKAAEWALGKAVPTKTTVRGAYFPCTVLNGSLRIQTMDADGKTFIDDVEAGGNDPSKLCWWETLTLTAISFRRLVLPQWYSSLLAGSG
jgi:hypothetical protein